jgi:hypothetical protein
MGPGIVINSTGLDPHDETHRVPVPLLYTQHTGTKVVYSLLLQVGIGK